MKSLRPIHAVAAAVCLVSLAMQAGDAFAFRRGPVSLTSDGVGPVLPDPPAERAAAARRASTPKPVDPMQAIRGRMVARQVVSYEDLQALADSGDDLAAYFLAKRIEAFGKPELGEAALHYYARAAYGGRAAAIRPMVKLLDARGASLKPSLLADAQAALEAQAAMDHETAVDALVRYYIQGTPFGSDPKRAEDLLKRSAERGNAQIALDLAMRLLSGAPTAEKKADAVRYLRLAALSDTLGTRTMAENLLRDVGTPIVASTDAIAAPIPAIRQELQ